MVWVVSRSELGWEPQRKAWTQAVRGVFGLDPARKLGARDPDDQARFWLSQTESVKSTDTDASVAIGAAWILNAPRPEFRTRYTRKRDPSDDAPGFQFFSGFDDDAIEKMLDEFESLCGDRRRAFIETAVRLDPDNVEVWRARALLAFRQGYGLELEPRDKDWLTVLDECAQHDRGNALYDYLAASNLWELSAEWKFQGEETAIDVHDPETYAQASERLESGLAKPFLRFGTESYPSTMAFVRETALSASDQVDACEGTLANLYASTLLLRSGQRQLRAAEITAREGDPRSAVKMLRGTLTMADQLTETGNDAGVLELKFTLRRFCFAQLQALCREHPDLLSDEETKTISAGYAKARLDKKVLFEVGKRLDANKRAVAESASLGDGALYAWLIWMALGASAAVLFVLVACSLGVAAWVTARFVGTKGSDTRVGWFRQIAAWLFAFAVTYVLWGLVPAKVISPEVQTGFMIAMLWIAFSLPFLACLIVCQRQFQVAWNQLVALLVASVLLVGVVGYWPLVFDAGVAVVANVPTLAAALLLLPLLGATWWCLRSLIEFTRSEAPAKQRLSVTGCVLVIVIGAFPSALLLAEFVSSEMKPKAWIAPTLWAEARDLPVTATEVQQQLQFDKASWTWALIQWELHGGAIIWPLIAVAILAIWCVVRFVRTSDGGLREVLRTHWRSRVREVGYLVAASCFVMSLACSIPYLHTAPTLAEASSKAHVARVQRLVNPAQTWQDIAMITAEVEADEQAMSRFRDQLGAEDRREADRNSE